MRLVRPVALQAPPRAGVAASLIVAVGILSPGHAAAQRFDAAGNPVLTSGTWAQLTVPADASAVSLAGLFGDDLPPSLHVGNAVAGSGTAPAWVVYTYDAGTRAYARPGTDDSLAPGQAFWILQVTGRDVTLDVPEGLPAVVPVASDACGAATGCFGIGLPVDAERASYAMLGSPSGVPLEVSAVRFATTGPGEGGAADPCTDGCDLDAAGGLGYTVAGVWTYDPDAGANGAGGYALASVAATLPPWTGFWTATVPAVASLAPRLLLPMPDGPPPWPPERQGAIAVVEIDVPNPEENGTYRVEIASLFERAPDAAATWSVQPAGQGVDVTPEGVLVLTYRPGDIDDFPPFHRWGGRVTASDPAGTSDVEIEVYLNAADPDPFEES